ncbi:MAG: hypothetical protein ACF8Q5_04900 [Phycisphaerales bacterium JB040]
MKIEMLIAGLTAGVALAQSPYTETFDTGNALWADAASQPLDWTATGSIDGTGYVSSTVNAAGIDPQFGALAFRGQVGLGSSGGAFAGDYLSNGIDTISFDVRHDSTDALSFYVRVATPGNFPAVLFLSPVAVTPGEWTTLSFALDESSPFTVPEGGPGTFETVLSGVGNLQIGFSAPATQTSGDIAVDLDNVSIVPTPATAALLGLGGLVATRRRR